MKIRILKNIDVDIDKTTLREVWPKYILKNDIFSVEKIEQINSKFVNLILDDGDVLLEIPLDIFEIK